MTKPKPEPRYAVGHEELLQVARSTIRSLKHTVAGHLSTIKALEADLAQSRRELAELRRVAP